MKRPMILLYPGLSLVSCRDSFSSDPRAVLTVDRDSYRLPEPGRGPALFVLMAHVRNLSADTIRIPRCGDKSFFDVLDRNGNPTPWSNHICIRIPFPDVVIAPFSERIDTLPVYDQSGPIDPPAKAPFA